MIVKAMIRRGGWAIPFACMTFVQAQEATTNAPPVSALNASMEATNSPTPEQQMVIGGEGRVNRLTLAHKANADLGRDVAKLVADKKYDEALDRLNGALQENPQNLLALNLRGFVYTEMQKWDLAQKDFETMLQINDRLNTVRFNLVEIKFRQKFYDLARPDFTALEADPDLADLAAYKVYLCDLFGGHTHQAREELDVFNLTGMNPSYYYGNAAWELFNKRPEKARPWLVSAARIYFPAKVENYSRSLLDLGYLPLPAPPSATSSSTEK